MTDATVQPSGVEQSATIAALGKALATAQAGFAHPTKSRTVDVGNYHYSYAELPAVIDAVRPALAANGISLLQPVEVRGTHVRIWTMLLHTSGEWIRSALVLTADNPKPQAVGSAITYGRRYGLSAMLSIAADEDEDGAIASSAAAAPAPASAEAAPRPVKKVAAAPRRRQAETMRVRVTDVQSKEKDKKDGSGTFTIYRVAFDDARIAETFSQTIAEQAESALEMGLEVTRDLEEPENPKFLPKLKGLVLIEPEPIEADDDDIPF